MEREKTTKKVIIIGGGIAGLTAGIYAKKAGFEAEIYEKHKIVGGECTGWDRNGYYIDNCIHWMMGTVEGTGLHKIWKETGAIADDTEILRSDHMYTSELNGESITLWGDMKRTERELIALSPEDEAEIRSLMHYAKLSENIEIPSEKPSELMGIADGVRMGLKMKNALKLFQVYGGMDTADLAKRFRHPLIRCMISDFCPEEAAGSSFPMAYGNYTGKDGGVPRGGSRAMAFRMKDRFESLGGEVNTASPIVKVEFGPKQAGGEKKMLSVTLANGRTVRGDYFVFTCDPDYTFHKLLSEDYLDPVLKEVYANRRDYPIFGMFQCAFGVDCAEDVPGGDIMMDTSDITAALTDELKDYIKARMTVKSFGYEPDFAPKGKQILQVMMGLTEDAYEYWAALYQDQKAYQAKKEELAALLQKKLETRFPEYRGKMMLLDVWTPMTYKRYCNAFKGYNQAYIITKRSRRNAYVSPVIRGVENAWISGQWLSSPGGLPSAAIQGKYSIQRILRKEGRSEAAN